MERNGRPLQKAALQEANITTSSAALLYLTQGWAVVPILPRSKAPQIREWQNLRITPEAVESYFAPRDNIGLLLGEPSGGLVDVDLDCEMARQLAPYFLPETGMIHGRDSARFSHWWYLCPELQQSIRLHDPEQRHTIAEIRSTGGQTVVPPSIHPSGEPLRWETETLEPAQVDADTLKRALHTLAAACLLASRWSEGTRHELTLALSGALCRAGYPEEQALHFVEAIARVARDEELNDRLRAVRDTYKAICEGREATGLPTLIDLLGERVGEKLREWLGLEARAVVRLNGKRVETEQVDAFEVERAERKLPAMMPAKQRREHTQSHAIEWLPLLGVEGLIAKGTTTLLAGDSKAGKTTLLVHACREWIRQGLKVGYLTEEPFDTVWLPRITRFPELGELWLNTYPKPELSEWLPLVKEEQFDVIAVDTVRWFAGIQNEWDAAQVATALQPFVLLTREPFRPAVILAHHMRKSGTGESVRDVAGSMAFPAVVDTVLTLTSNEENPYQRDLTVNASRLWLVNDPAPFAFELSPDGEQFRYVGRAGKAESLSEWDVVREYLQQKGEATYDEIWDALQEAGIDISRKTLENKAAIWRRNRLIITERRGCPPTAYIRLNEAKIRVSPNSPDSPYIRASGQLENEASLNSPNSPDMGAGDSGELKSEATLNCPDFPIKGESGNSGESRNEAVPDGLPRSPLVIEENDPLEQFIEQATRPDDPFALAPYEVEALRLFWAFAEAAHFPALYLAEYGYTIPAGKEGYANALYDIASPTCLLSAIKQIQAVCSHTGQDTNSHSDMGHDGIVPPTA